MSGESEMQEKGFYRRANGLGSLDQIHAGLSLLDDRGLVQSLFPPDPRPEPSGGRPRRNLPCRIRVKEKTSRWRRSRTVKKEDVVSRDPEVVSGALVFTGTRVPVEVLIQHLTAGDTLDEFLEGFPTVTREQAIAYLEMTPEAVDALVAR